MCAGCAVKVYSTVSHELVHVLSRHEAAITSCCLNPGNSLQVAHTHTIPLYYRILHVVHITHVLPSLQLLTASLDGKVMIWDYLDGSFLRVK